VPFSQFARGCKKLTLKQGPFANAPLLVQGILFDSGTNLVLIYEYMFECMYTR